MASKFSKLIFVSDQKQLLSSEHAAQEGLSGLLTELRRGHNHRIDLAAQATLHRVQRLYRIREAHAANEQQIHVAAGSLVATCHRTEHQREL